MRLEAAKGFRGRVFDLDTGREIPKVLWVDTGSGEFAALQTGARGEPLVNAAGECLTYRGVGRLKVLQRQPDGTTRTVRMGAPACAKCRSPLTLPGDDLCPLCRGADRQVKAFQPKHRRVTDPLALVKCDRCDRPATWQVADEVEATPELASGLRPWGGRGRMLFARAQTVAQRFYCSWCWRPPRLLDARGEEVRSFDDVGVRPQ